MARGFGATFGSASTDIITSSYATGLTDGGVRTYSIWAIINSYGGGGLGRMFDRSDSGTANETLYVTSGLGFSYSVRYTTTNSSWGFADTGSQDGNWHNVILTFDNGSPSNHPVCYLDGSTTTETFSGGGSGTTVNPSTAFTIGNRKSDSQRCFDGVLAEFAVWNAILSAGEIAALAKRASPLLIRPGALAEYVPMVRPNLSYKVAAPSITGTAVAAHPRIIMPRRFKGRRFKPTSTAKTLAAGAGSYAVTGTAAALLLKRKLTADVGAYAITGTAAALNLGKRLTAAAGSYALTGTDANPLHGWRATAVAGSYAITGTAANLLHKWVLAAAAGAYNINGTDVGLIKPGNKTLPAGAGAYALTGTAAALLHKDILTAAAGSYAINGATANLKHGWAVPVSAGAYAINGQPVTLRRNLPLVAGAGAYAINGQAATLKQARKLIAGSGIYLLTGTDASLQHGLFNFTPELRIAYSVRQSGLREVDSVAGSRTVESD